MYHESRDQTTQGQLAVGQVTLNRVANKHYPNRVCDVVYQKGKKSCAFSWTCDGLKDDPYEIEAWQKSLDLAKKMLGKNPPLSGLGSDVTHYHTFRVKPYWAGGKIEKVKRIGDHIFYTWNI